MRKTHESLPDYEPCVECGFWVQRDARLGCWLGRRLPNNLEHQLIPFVMDLQTGCGSKFQPEKLQEYIDKARRALTEAPPEVQEKWRDLIDRAERLHDEWLLRLAADNVRRVRPLEEDQLRDLVEPLLEELDLEDPTLAWGEEWDDLEEEYRRLTGEMEAVEEVEQLVRGA